jgi:5,10-methylenetetrahydromethanopterin reductase
MRIGCLFPPTLATPEHIRIAEELGYACALVYDSPAFLADPWMVLAQAAQKTERITLGISVITPRLRHLVASAGALATLAAMAPGRTEVVVGSGFTSQLMLGRPPAPWAEVEAYVNGLRALLAGEDLEWDGATIGLRHGARTGVGLPVEMPIRVAAHGPKGYAVAQRSADGVVTNLGHHTANAGGPPDPERAMVLFYGTVLDDGEPLDAPRVVDATGPYAAFQLHIGAEGGAGGSAEHAAFHASIEAEVAEGVRHLEVHRGHLLHLTERERPLITPSLIAAATETGTRAEVAARLEDIAASGVEGVLYGPMGDDVPRELQAFAELALAQPSRANASPSAASASAVS